MRRLLLSALIAASMLAACGRTCKTDGCSEKEIYEDGYCRLHYYENVGHNILNDLFD